MSPNPEFDSRPLAERFPGRDFVALPRAFWPRSAADLAGAKERWGGHIVLRFQRAVRCDHGHVKEPGGLVGVLVEQGSNEPRFAPVSRPEIASSVQEFLRKLAQSMAKAWSKESLRQAGGFSDP